MMDCNSYNNCKAPLCPKDKDAKYGVWFPDEDICNGRFVKPKWVEIQRRIVKKTDDITRCFNVKMLSRIKGVRKPRGLDPDRLLEK